MIIKIIILQVDVFITTFNFCNVALWATRYKNALKEVATDIIDHALKWATKRTTQNWRGSYKQVSFLRLYEAAVAMVLKFVLFKLTKWTHVC